MANISFLASSQATSGNASTLSVTAPAGTTIGDLVIVIAARNAFATTDSIIDNNAGHVFTKDRHDWEAGNGLSLVIFSKRIVSGDPGSYSFKFSGDTGTTRFSLGALTFRDPDGTTIYDVIPSGTTEVHKSPDSATVNIASVTSTRSGCVHVMCATREGGTGQFDSTPTGYTKELTLSGGSALNTIWYKVLGAAGATGAQTVTASGGGSGSTQTQSFIILNGAAPASFTLTANSGAYTESGVDATLRIGAFTYLRYSK